MIFKNLFENQNWNIGFLQLNPNQLIENRKIGKVRWMKHPYKDRFFADPFILKKTETEIIVFVEELIFQENKGRLVELIVDKFTLVLKKRYVLLELNTHLSYPIILRKDNKVYVYPENSASGKLNLYEYIPNKHSLQYVCSIIDEPLTDATILKKNNSYFLFATKLPEDKENLILYNSSSDFGEYMEKGYKVFGLDKSRMAGSFFESKGNLYRPAQNCSLRYGQGIEIMQVDRMENKYMEHKLFSINPHSFKYNLGIHTINFHENICVVDGYGYLHPILGRLHHYYFKLRNLFS